MYLKSIRIDTLGHCIARQRRGLRPRGTSGQEYIDPVDLELKIEGILHVDEESPQRKAQQALACYEGNDQVLLTQLGEKIGTSVVHSLLHIDWQRLIAMATEW